MNKNPLLVKNFLMGKIPFMKEKTLALYSKYLSNHQYSKTLVDHKNLTEVLSAYNLGSTYKTDFIFDGADITPDINFNENEWIALGMLLRAYKEVEGVSLMHLYNCFYRGENNTVYGHVVTGRTYTLYASTQLRVTIKIYVDPDNPLTIIEPSLSSNSPCVLEIPKIPIESLVRIELDFTGITYQPANLAEGVYSGIKLKTLGSPYAETNLIPESLRVGEYSDKLIEFFAGTLITPLSDPKLISRVSDELTSTGTTFQERVITSTPGWHNKDGYVDRRLKI